MRFQKPEPLPTNIPVAERYEAWLDWKEGFDVAASVCVPSLTDQQMSRLLFTSVGPETQKIIRLLGLPPSEKGPWPAGREFSDLSSGLNRFFRGMVDESVDHARFHEGKQGQKEGIHDYAMRMKRLAASVDVNPSSFSFRHQLLKGMRNQDLAIKATDDNIPLGDIIQTAARKEQREASEQAKRPSQWFPSDEAQPSVAAFSAGRNFGRARQFKRPADFERSNGPEGKAKSCRYCGGRSHMDKKGCPAFGKSCNSCGIKNHFEKVCEKKNKKVSAVEAVDQNEAKSQEFKVRN